jgi:hypothetical protein
MIPLWHNTVLRVNHRKHRSLGKSFGQQHVTAWVEMLNDDKGRAACSRQSGQQFGDGLEVARRRSYGYDRKSIHPLLVRVSLSQ